MMSSRSADDPIHAPTEGAGEEPIIAVASAREPSLRGVVRLSGAGVFQLVAACLASHERIAGDDRAWPARGLYRAVFRLGPSPLPLLVLAFPGPRSYTGEDSVELHTVGNPHVLDRIVETLLSAPAARERGARPAGPGEFTARAYLNQRLSLTEAEGVERAISARSDAELRAAHQLIEGRLGELVHQLADELAAALALVEAGIDFTDQEDVVAISPADLEVRLGSIRTALETHLAHAVGSEAIAAIPLVVLVGPPNAGKSTLFNALLGRERAIVSAVAGTTRDVLTEPLAIDTARGSVEVMLADLAGLDEQDDAWLNVQMQAHARAAIDRADLLIVCLPPEARGWRDAKLPARTPTIVIATKADAGEVRDVSSDQLAVSARTGIGLDALRSRIASRLSDDLVPLGTEVLALKPRHELAMREALNAVNEARAIVEPQRANRHLADAELVASSLRAALDRLGELAGDITPDDVLGRIFATFCVGK